MSAYLQISNLTKNYGQISALTSVDLNVHRGSVLALLGPNGAGKSTLFGCVLGLILPTNGKVQLDGREPTAIDRTRIGYVPERIALYPQRTVAENAAFFAQLKGHSLASVEAQLKRVGLENVLKRQVRRLSKGMLQRLGVAIALCGEPELLILDEPFNGLDPASLETLQATLTEERQRGATLLISTHTISAVEPLATHVAILVQSRLAISAGLEELRADYLEKNSLESIYQEIVRQQHETEFVLA